MLRSTSTKMAALAGVELLLSSSAVLIGGFVRLGGEWPTTTQGPLLWLRALVFGVVVVVALTAMGLYQSRQRLNVEGTLVRVLIGLSFAAVGLAVIYYFLPALALWRGWWLLSVVLTLLLVGVSRATFARLADQAGFRRRVVVYGAGKRAAKLLQLRRRSDQRGFQIVAFLPVPGEADLIQDERVDRSPGDVRMLSRKHEAEEIVIAME